MTDRLATPDLRSPDRRLWAAVACAVLLASLAAPAPAAAQSLDPDADEQTLWVGPVYFSWFDVTPKGKTRGQYYSPWVPKDGRMSWDGSVKFHKRHLKHIVKARFNMIFAVDTWDYHQEQENLFRAIRDRQRKGKKVPKVAPYFAAGTLECRECRKDFARRSGRDKLFRAVERWFESFFSVLDRDDLVWIDDRVLIGLWWIPGAETAQPDLFHVLSNRLEDRFGFRAFWSVNFTFESGGPDELNWTFASLSGREVNELHNVDLLTGFWPPGVQPAENFLARDGGRTYERAWDEVIERVSPCGIGDPNPFRITIVSYNELTEGSGIYPAKCMGHTKGDRHWSGPPSEERCVEEACHPHRKNDRWAPSCRTRRASFHYLDISRNKIQKLERKLRAVDACRGS